MHIAVYDKAGAFNVKDSRRDRKLLMHKEEIIKDKSYYDNSGGGVTFSGGECMLHIDFLCAILKKCKENGKGRV